MTQDELYAEYTKMIDAFTNIKQSLIARRNDWSKDPIAAYKYGAAVSQADETLVKMAKFFNAVCEMEREFSK